VADEQQLALIKRGSRAWNEWRERDPSRRVDLSEADLSGADLTGAKLASAESTGARLKRASLIGACLNRANLRGENLGDADLSSAELIESSLVLASLTGANLTRARLGGANLNDANLDSASLNSADLGGALGLESVKHLAPSALDHRTLLRSRSLPLSFLRGRGLPDPLIDYLPSLLDAEPIQFYSCFISYSTANEGFAKRLYADLQERGVRCWFAPHDIEGGKKIHDQIDEAIRVYDRLLLILSTESMSSRWVRTEIEKARVKEVRLNRNVLFPLALVPFSEIRAWRQFDSDLGEDTARAVREYFIPDFTGWETDHGRYVASFEKLLASLKSADIRPGFEEAAEANDAGAVAEGGQI
jgi:uncharacterized protein YjbI with pentapeptide repeats